MATLRVLSRKARIREADKQMGALVRRLEVVYFASVEVLIMRYSRALWDVVRSYMPKLQQGMGGHTDRVLEDMMSDLERCGEQYMRAAANYGYERGLRDLQARGWIKGYFEPVICPPEAIASKSASNSAYLTQSLLPDIKTAFKDVAKPDDVPPILARFRSRIGQYAHWLWPVGQQAYREACNEFFTFYGKEKMREGGAGSGYHDHPGRPGAVGGSLPEGRYQRHEGQKVSRNTAPAVLTRHIVETYNSADDDTKLRGKHWYPAAKTFATGLSKQYHVSVSTAAGVIAALSPQTSWEKNMMFAKAFFANEGAHVGQTQDNESKALAIYKGGDPNDVLGSSRYPKTPNFYRNIMDPSNSSNVAIDRHALSVAHDVSLTQTQQEELMGRVGSYDKYKAAYQAAAEQLHLPASEVQATTWTHWREHHTKNRIQTFKETENYELVEGGEGSGDYGHAGRHGLVGGSAGDEDAIGREAAAQLSQAKPVEGETFGVVNFTGTLFHGTGDLAELQAKGFTKSPSSRNIYLTTVAAEARVYARGGVPTSSTHDLPAKENTAVMQVHLNDAKLISVADGYKWGSAESFSTVMRRGYDGVVRSIESLTPDSPPSYIVQMKDGDKLSIVGMREGGEGSGNFSHAGRPGEVGGSAAGSGLLFQKGLDPTQYHAHAERIIHELDAAHTDDPTYEANVAAVQHAMANYPMIHATGIENIQRIATQGLTPANLVGKGFTFDKIAGLDRTVFMRMGQAGGGGHGAIGVMVDPSALDADKFYVTRLGLMGLKADVETELQTPGDHRAFVDEKLQPFRDTTIALSDLPAVQSHLLVNGYLKDHPDARGTKLDPAAIVENDHGEMEVKYMDTIPTTAITAYFAGNVPHYDGKTAAQVLREEHIPNVVEYEGDDLHALSRAYRAHYAATIREAMREGSASSGDFGHVGRPGARGGSLPSGMDKVVADSKQYIKKLSVKAHSPITETPDGTVVMGEPDLTLTPERAQLAVDEVRKNLAVRGQPPQLNGLKLTRLVHEDGTPEVYGAAFTNPQTQVITLNTAAAEGAIKERDAGNLDPGGIYGDRLPQTADDIDRYTLDHEMGHILMANHHDLTMEWITAYRSVPPGMWERRVSRYAASSYSEGFAEAYSAYVHRDYEHIPGAARNVLDKWLKGDKLAEAVATPADSDLVEIFDDFIHGIARYTYADGRVETCSADHPLREGGVGSGYYAHAGRPGEVGGSIGGGGTVGVEHSRVRGPRTTGPTVAKIQSLDGRAPDGSSSIRVELVGGYADNRDTGTQVETINLRGVSQKVATSITSEVDRNLKTTNGEPLAVVVTGNDPDVGNAAAFTSAVREGPIMMFDPDATNSAYAHEQATGKHAGFPSTATSADQYRQFVIDHEFGHVYEQRITDAQQGKFYFMYQRWANTDDDVHEKLQRQFPYGISDHHELFAEMYATYVNGHETDLPPNARTYFTSLLQHRHLEAEAAPMSRPKSPIAIYDDFEHGTWTHKFADGTIKTGGVDTTWMREGGAGSGDYGHAGRPGSVGGSVGGGGDEGEQRIGKVRVTKTTTTSKTLTATPPHSDRIKDVVWTPEDINGSPKFSGVEVHPMKVDPHMAEVVVNELDLNLEKQNNTLGVLALGAIGDQLITGSGTLGITNWRTGVMAIDMNVARNAKAVDTIQQGDTEEAYSSYLTDYAHGADEVYRAVVDHEAGHVYYGQMGDANRTKWVNIFARTQSSLNVPNVAPGSYAGVNDKEAFAESYIYYVNGKGDMLSPEARSFFDGVKVHQLREADIGADEPEWLLCDPIHARSTYIYADGSRRTFGPPLREGGEGSGDFAHAGRPGEVGGSTPTGGHQQTATNEPGMPTSGPAPWDLKAQAPPRYPGDTSVFSPAMRDASGNYVLGRRIQGTALTKDPGKEVAMYEFIPSAASPEQLGKFEREMQAHADHAQSHPGILAYNDAQGNLVQVPGDHYWVRGEYTGLQELDKTLTPEITQAFGDKHAYSQMMTDATPDGTKITTGDPLMHIRVVVPFAAGTPENTVGEPAVSEANRMRMLSVLAGADRHAWSHADFNGIHIATSAPTSQATDLFKRVSELGGARDEAEYHEHGAGATRFVKPTTSVEIYPVRGYKEAVFTWTGLKTLRVVKHDG